MKIRPVFDRLTVEKVEQADVTAGGILIPQEAKSPSQLGVVLAVGHGRNYDGPGRLEGRIDRGLAREPIDVAIDFQRPAMVVKAGDKVLFGRYAGAEVEIDGRKVFILREDEVLAIVEEELGDVKPAAEEPAPEEAPVHCPEEAPVHCWNDIYDRLGSLESRVQALEHELALVKKKSLDPAEARELLGLPDERKETT